MGKNRKTVGQQMKYWWVGWRAIRIKARTAKAAVRKWMRGNLEHAIMCRDYELDNPMNPKFELPSEVIREPGMRDRLRRLALQYTAKDIPVRPA